MNRRFLLALSVLGAAAAVFALLAFYSSVKPLPFVPPMLVFAWDFPYWVFESEVQAAAGFALVAVVLLLFQAKKLVPSVFRRALALPRAARDAALLTFAGGALFYGFYIVLDWLREEYPLALGYGIDPFAVSPTALGEAAFLSMAIAVAGLTVYRSNEGLWASFGDAVTRFAAPAIVALEVGLLLVSPSEMQRPVVNFTQLLPFPSRVYRIAILSNWLVLIVSSGIFVFGLVTVVTTQCTNPGLFSSDNQEAGRSEKSVDGFM